MVWQQDGVAVYERDCLEILPGLEAGSVNCCVTSPPYWGLRDYGHDDQIGLERTPADYINTMVEVFRAVRRVLRDDGTLWLNLGDTYNAYNGGAGPGSKLSKAQTEQRPKLSTGYGLQDKSLKPKDLIGIPWRVALALQADGWWLRQDIIWHKPNPMPESVTDRCTKSHEYIFLLSKSERYYYDHGAIMTPHKEESLERWKAGGEETDNTKYDKEKPNTSVGNLRNGSNPLGKTGANKRSVWTVNTKPYPQAHFATFPPELITPCIMAGCPEGGTVLDPFTGSGTTAEVAQRNGCKFVGCELNPEYIELIKSRFAQRSFLLDAAGT